MLTLNNTTSEWLVY